MFVTVGTIAYGSKKNLIFQSLRKECCSADSQSAGRCAAAIVLRSQPRLCDGAYVMRPDIQLEASLLPTPPLSLTKAVAAGIGGVFESHGDKGLTKRFLFQSSKATSGFRLPAFKSVCTSHSGAIVAMQPKLWSTHSTEEEQQNDTNSLS